MQTPRKGHSYKLLSQEKILKEEKGGSAEDKTEQYAHILS